ncbi:hypothetical protein EV714DRAFT_197943 [Schizophyllum commune]
MGNEKVWLITGSNSGFGLALAELVLSHGHKVIACARDLKRIPPSIAQATPLQLDLSWPDDQIKAALKDVEGIYGRVDVLFNNAGWPLVSPVEELLLDELEKQFKVNFFGHISVTQAVLPIMKKQKSGQIYMMSSVAAMAGMSPFAAYNSSKAALEAISEALAREVERWNISVTIVEAGYFPTGFLGTAATTQRATSTDKTDYPEFVGQLQTYDDLHIKAKQVGDTKKAVQRIFEVVEGTAAAELKPQWRRLPLGPDAGKRILGKLQLMKENVEAYEPIWSTTDMDEDKIEDFFKQREGK